MTLSTKTLKWIGRAINTSPAHFEITPMKGSNSSPVLLIQNQDRQKFVLRLLNSQTWLAEEPDLARHEAAALNEAHKTGLPVPEIIAYSEDSAETDFPLVLTTFLEGKVELNPANFNKWLEELAGNLTNLHQHRAPDFSWHYCSWNNKDNLRSPDWSTHSTNWNHAIELVRNSMPDFQPVFIHRDYHPTNVLWSSNTISGIVDWINACQGPAGVDVAHCRNNLALMYGVKAADQFLEMYIQASSNFKYNAYWDIDSILNMCLPFPEFYKPWREFGMESVAPEVLQRRTEDYLNSVIERI